MTLIKLSANQTLKGHKALLLSDNPRPDKRIEAIKRRFPDLEVEFRKVLWISPTPGDGFTDEDWKKVTILLTGSALPKPESAPKLQYVQLQSAGANHIVNQPVFKDTHVPFCTANGIHGPQISEWVIGTFLAFQHSLPEYRELQKQGKWQRLRQNGEVEDAVGRRVGILGYGSIGRQVARVATAMGMSVHAYTLHPRDTPESRRDRSYAPGGLGDPQGTLPAKWFSGGSAAEIREFLGSGLDLLVVSVPLTEKTRHLLSKPEFEVLSERRTYVSNIARGPIVHTGDLIEALEKGLIRGAALDVTDPEPLPDGHPLWNAKNVTITPHVSGSSTAYFERTLDIFQLNLERLSQERPLINEAAGLSRPAPPRFPAPAPSRCTINSEAHPLFARLADVQSLKCEILESTIQRTFSCSGTGATGMIYVAAIVFSSSIDCAVVMAARLLAMIALLGAISPGSGYHTPIKPMIINTWGGDFTSAADTAFVALRRDNATAIDAVEAGCLACEHSQCDGTVGYGGSPDENCETTLDAMIMDGTSMKSGAVAALRRVRSAISVARHVLEHTTHTLLAGDLATEFALQNGFQSENLTTEASSEQCRAWRADNCQPNYRLNVKPDATASCGPYQPGDHLARPASRAQASHDTLSIIALHADGTMAAGTTTNGAAHKIPGRVGDGPITGSGSYVDGEAGGCGATGDGDVMMRFLPCYQAVENLRRGMSPTEASEDAVRRMLRKNPNISSGIVVMDKEGRHGAAASGWTFTYSYRGGDMDETRVVTVAPVDSTNSRDGDASLRVQQSA